MSFRSGISLPARQAAAPNVMDDIQQQLKRLQQRNNGLDFGAASQVSGVTPLQEPLPELDFAWTWDKEGQRGWKLTVNSMRGGLNMQRGRIELAHLRLSESDLVSHSRDELILPFETEVQGYSSSLQAQFTNYNLIHANFLDRKWMAPYLSTATSSLWTETSSSDPTVINRTGLGPQIYIYSLANVMVQGREHLLIFTSEGCHFLDADIHFAKAYRIFNVVTSLSGPAASGGAIFGSASGGGGAQGISLPSLPWGGGQTTESFIGIACIQSPLPGNPLIVRSQNAVLLVPVEPSATSSDPYSQNASLMLKNVGLGACQAIGFLRTRQLSPKAYWWETNSGGPASAGTFKSRIASTNAYGHDYQVHDVSLQRIIGATANRRRGSLHLTDGLRMIDWDGGEDDLQMFSDESTPSGYKLFCTGIYESDDGELRIEVNELPYSSGGVAQGHVRACKRRYDFELRRWFQISEWNTLTEDGLIRWSNGIPIPVGRMPNLYGYMSAFGGPDLPVGGVTRSLHNYAVQARYTENLSGVMPVSSSTDITWFNKFEPPPATNPYSLIGIDRTFSTEGTARMAAQIFPPGYEYADKYIDLVEWGGQDTGGSGSSVTVRIGEGGRMDETNPGPLHHTFNNGVSHEGRRRPWANNQTSLLFPQIEVSITRGTSNLTPQALPITIHGHLDLPDELPKREKRRWGRSKG